LKELETDYTLAQSREVGKIQPELDELAANTEQRRQQIQDTFQQRQIALQTLQELEDDGAIDPRAALQKKWQLAGYSFPLSAFSVGPPTVEDELQDIKQYIQALQAQLSSREGRMIMGVAGQLEVQAQLTDLRARQIELLERQMEKYAPKSKAFANAARQQIGRNQPSTLAGRIALVKEKKTDAQKKTDPLGLR
jgi:hypothetical protein